MHITLFFTRGMSLKAWDQIGMFDREVALYQRLVNMGVTVFFVTYGDATELNYQDRLPGIQILCNRWGLPNRVYENFLHRFHGKALRSSDLMKTNQTKGAEIALRSARFWKKPLIARMGYMLSDFVARQSISSNGAVMKAINMENELFTFSRRIVVTTEEMVLNIRKRITEVSEKTVVIPNYVETDRFEPDGSQAKDFDVLFVGRLSPQKNISVLLMALNDLDAKAIIIGNGELRDELQTQFGDLNGKIEWGGNVPNSELPSMMNNSRIFVLPSHYEGHPKTLIEAMSCGMPIVGADSPGIREIIDHGVNGYLCGTDAESIRSVLEKLLNKPDLCKYLGKNARLYAVENFSLDRTLEMEYQMYKEVISESKTTTSN